MSLFVIWPVVVLTASSIALFSIPEWFRSLDATPTGTRHRLQSIDGLRAFLAIAVVFHHIAVRRWSIEVGHLSLPPSQFFSLLGQVGVSIFFMITGFLFWGRLIDRQGVVDWAKLYVDRFFRIAPLYWVVIAIYFFVVLSRARFEIHTPLLTVLSEMAKWAAIGTFQPEPLLGDAGSLSITGTMWTLYFEWIFYFSLPIIAIFARARGATAFSVVSLFLVLHLDALIPEPYRIYVAQFLVGMTCASLSRAFPKSLGDGPVRSLIAAAAIALAFKVYDTAYTTGAVILLGIFFGFVSTGTSIFGLLKLRGAVRLGNMSYSIYLLHGTVLTVLFAPSTLQPFAMRTPANFWLAASCFYVVVIAISTLSYLVVERNGIRLGKSLLKSRSERLATSETTA